MMRYKSTIGVAAATFALSLAPAWAQERSRPADTPATGTAVARAEAQRLMDLVKLARVSGFVPRRAQ